MNFYYYEITELIFTLQKVNIDTEKLKIIWLSYTEIQPALIINYMKKMSIQILKKNDSYHFQSFRSYIKIMLTVFLK